MAGESVEIRIIAHDGTSQVFRAIQQNADRLGRDLTDAGKDGDRAFDQIEKGAKDADRALETASRSARTFGDRIEGAARGIDSFGEGLTVIGAGLTYAGNKAMEQERQIIALRAAYGDAAEGMIQFAEELDSVTIFSDEDIRAGERFFASLYNNYDLSIQQIQELMRITADLASASGTTYEDASNRVTAAIRGEGEAAEWLGLTMNQQSIDRENLTLSMSNQEAAQFRLNALLEQSAVYEGTAQQMHESSIGTYAELTDQVNDFAGGIGETIGPMGSMLTGIGTMSIGLSGMVGVFGKAAAGARALTTSMSGLAAATSMWTAALALGGGTGAAIGGFLGEIYVSMRDGESATKAFSDATNILAAAMNKLKGGDPVGFFRTLVYGIEEADTTMRSFNTTLSTLWDEAARQQVLGNDAVAEGIRQLVGETDNAIHSAEAYVQSAEFQARAMQDVVLGGATQEQAIANLTAQYTQSEAELAVYNEAVAALGRAFLDPAVNADQLNMELDALKAQFDRHEITLDQYREGLVELAREYGDLPGDIQSTSAALDGQAGSFNLVTYALNEQRRALDEYKRAKEGIAEAERLEEEHAEAYAERQQQRYDDERQRREQRRNEEKADREARERAAAEAAQREAEHEEAVAAAQQTRFDEERAQREQRRAEEEADHDARVQQARDFIATMREVSGFDSPLATLDMTSLSTDAMAFARYVQVGNDALANTFRIVVSNTNAMGQTVQATADWIDELAYAEDGWTKVNQLQADGFINEQQMNAVFAARTSILEDNAHVQNDILTMQALQAPLMADLVSQQADYIHQLSNQSAEQQLVALGWMDSASAAQAYTIVTQAAAVATGDLGATGRAAFEDMVQGAIAANPVLEQMLIDIGLIARDHEGNLTFNYDGMEQANSEIKMLTESILMLVDVLDDGEINGSVSLDTLEAQQNADDLARRLGELDGTEANTTINGDSAPAENAIRSAGDALRGLDGDTATTYQEGVPDGALGAISNVAQDLAGLDGRSATVYINAVNNAGAALGSVASQLWALDGQSATVTTNYVTTYSTVGDRPLALGGTVWGDDGPPPTSPWGLVPQAANGRTVLVGEVGPELVTLPHGSQVAPHVASLSRSEPGGISISIPIYGNVYGIDDLTEQVTRQLAPEIRAVAEDIRASQMRVS